MLPNVEHLGLPASKVNRMDHLSPIYVFTTFDNLLFVSQTFQPIKALTSARSIYQARFPAVLLAHVYVHSLNGWKSSLRIYRLAVTLTAPPKVHSNVDQFVTRKRLAKLGNIAVETLFLLLLPSVAKLGSMIPKQSLHPGSRKVFDLIQKTFLFPRSTICFRNIRFSCG